MTEESASAPIDKRTEFLRDALEAAEKRRGAVENKSSILLASNAILLTAIASFGFPVATPNLSSSLLWLRYGLTVICLGGVAVSGLCAVLVLAPLTAKQRTQVMRLPSKEFNVFFSGKIAEYENARAYMAEVESLTEQQIFEQLGTQLYNLSRLVIERYKWFHRSQRALVLSILTFIVLALTWIL